MNDSTCDMSIDSSLIISNKILDDEMSNATCNQEFEQIKSIDNHKSEKEPINLPNKIASDLAELINDKPVKQDNDLQNDERFVVKNKQTVESRIIDNKQGVDEINNVIQVVDQKRSDQITEPQKISSLNIQQIIHEINQNKNPNQDDKSMDSKIKIDPKSNKQPLPLIIEEKITVEKTIEQSKDQTESGRNKPLKELTVNKSRNEIEMNADESLRLNESQTINQIKINSSSKLNDMSVDDSSLVLNDIHNIFETSTSSTEFIIMKPSKKFETPKRKMNKDEMDTSSAANDSLILKEIKIENNPSDCLDESPYLKSLPPPTKVFKLSRKRLNCDTDSPIKTSHLPNNLFKSKFNTTPLISQTKKWRSATYNPMTSSPKKMDLVLSPLKPIDNKIICNSINNTINNLMVSNLNMMIQKSDQSPNLMGNYSGTYALPYINGRHKDLKTISPETLAKLMKGEYGKLINCFTIIDSRYPYEYEGGHIDGSKNIYHEEDINKYFFGTGKPTLITDKNLINNAIEKNIRQSSSNSMQRTDFKNSKKLNGNKTRLTMIKEGENDENNLHKIESNDLAISVTDTTQPIKRHAIIFHCEFSSERAPKICRYLRKIDRELNENCYPNLYYPEIYLLHGGYKLFFEKFKELCYPQTYLPMHSSDHKQDLVKFRTKSKSWNCARKTSISK